MILRFLMIDNQQMTYNMICTALQDQVTTVHGKLLDDQVNFEKMLNLQWDVIIYHAAYDFDYHQALTLLKQKNKTIPFIWISEIERHSSQGVKALEQGVTDIIAPHHVDLMILRIVQGLKYSRLIRREQQLTLENDQLQSQTQSLVETNEHALAIFQEGVHVSANDAYAQFFSIDHAQQLEGLPILDILQPEDKEGFKQFFKRLSRNDFNQPSLKMTTLNKKAKEQSLQLQFSSTVFDDEPALQLIIATHNDVQSIDQSTHFAYAQLKDIYNHLNFTYIQNPKIGLILVVLQSVPDHILQSNWHSARDYFLAIEHLIQTHIQYEVLKLSETVLLFLYPTDTQSGLLSFTTQLTEQLPTQVELDQHVYSLDMAVRGFLIEKMPTLDELDVILNQAFQGSASLPLDRPHSEIDHLPHLEFVTPALPVVSDHDAVLDGEHNAPAEMQAPQPLLANPALNTIQLGVSYPLKADAIPVAKTGLQVIENNSVEPSSSNDSSAVLHLGEATVPNQQDAAVMATESSIRSLATQIEHNAIILEFQQLYDKEDIDTHLFEVTSSFEHEGQRINLIDYAPLLDDAQLAVKLDRWVLVEASKRLHQYLATNPKSRIIVNLHRMSLLDHELIMLLNKLVNLINSRYSRPLILQFNEPDVLSQIEASQRFFQMALDQNVPIHIRDFGQSFYSTQLLHKLHFRAAKLSHHLSEKLSNDDGIIELQEKLSEWNEIAPDVRYVASQLDEMILFANAWNVDVRYLQGNYFQMPQPEFVDNSVE